MRIGIGLPNAVQGTDPAIITTWAARADAGPFSTLAVLDRLVYDSLEPLTSLAAAAAVTDRIGLATMIAIGPLRSTGALAKSAATVHRLSGGRLTLGLGLGARGADYDLAGVDTAGRGRRFDRQLADVRDLVEDDRMGPLPPSGPPRLLVGGLAGEAYHRAARYADGYAHNGGPPRAFANAASKARAAWREAGRPGEPLLWGQAYVGLGDPEAGRRELLDYYAFTGSFAERIAEGLLDTPRRLADLVRGYEDAGCDELILLPSTPDIDEVDRVAELIGDRRP